MTINLGLPETQCLKPRITVIGVGGAGGNAVSNMIASGLQGVDFVVANTDAQALSQSLAERRIQLGVSITQGLGAGSRPDIGKAAAEEALEEIMEQLIGSHMVFVTAGLGGGTGTGATPVVARAAREQGMLTVGVVTKPFHFEGAQRMRLADEGLRELQQFVDTLIIIPNQNLFRVANDKTTFADAFKMADDVLHAGVRGVTDLMVQPGLINLDFADVRTVMSEMGKAMMGTGEAEGDRRSLEAAEAAIANPLLDEVSMKGAKGVLINITGGSDMTLFEVDEAANRIREEVDPDANIIFGAAFDETMSGFMRVSLVATGIEAEGMVGQTPGRPALTAIEGGQAIRGAAPAAAAAPIVAKAGQHALALDTSRQPQPQPTPQSQAHIQPQAQVHPQAQVAVAQPLPAEAVAPEPVAVQQPEPAVAVAPQPKAETQAEPALQPRQPQPAPRTFSFLGRPEPKAQSKPAHEDAFIAPAAVEAPKQPATAARPDAFGSAALANNAGRKPSLFERMTGAARSREAREQARHEPEIQQSAQASAAIRPQPQPQPQPAPRPEARMEVSAVEDDVLDIPAFLRRQAN